MYKYKSTVEACSILYICISIPLKYYPDISPYHSPQLKRELPIKRMKLNTQQYYSCANQDHADNTST